MSFHNSLGRLNSYQRYLPSFDATLHFYQSLPLLLSWTVFHSLLRLMLNKLYKGYKERLLTLLESYVLSCEPALSQRMNLVHLHSTMVHVHLLNMDGISTHLRPVSHD